MVPICNQEQQVTARIHPKAGLKIIYPEIDHYEQQLYAAKLEKLNDGLEVTCIICTQKKADIHRDVLPKSKPQ